MEFLNRIKEYVPGHQARKSREQAEFERREQARRDQLEHVGRTLEEQRQDIQELGHEFADALRQGISRGTQKKQLDTSQNEFELAVSRFTGINQDDIRELAPKVYFLQLKEYLHRQEQDADPHLIEALHEAYRPGPIGASRHEKHMAKKMMRGVFEAHGYSQQEAQALLERDHLYAKQEELDAAVESLAQESLEAAQQFRGIEHDTIEELVCRIEEAFKHPSIEPHLKNSIDSVKIGVREIVARALFEHARHLEGLGEKTLSEHSIPSEFSSARLLTIDEYVDELESQLNNTKLIKEQAQYRKSYAEKKVNELRNLDLILTELERYAASGPIKEPAGVSDEAPLQWEWPTIIREEQPEKLRGHIRRLVQSIPQKDAKSMLLARRKDLYTELFGFWEKQNDARAVFAKTFTLLLENNYKKQWSGVNQGRDKLYFLHKDVQENTVIAQQRAARPLAAFEKELRQSLEKIRQEKIALLETMDDIDDLEGHEDLYARMRELGKKIDITPWAEEIADAIEARLNKLRKTAYDMQNNPERYAGGNKENQLRLKLWLSQHPITINEPPSRETREAA